MMRSRSNLAVMAAAAVLALALTAIRHSPEGVVSLGLDTQEVRAAPGATASAQHDLSALRIFTATLVRVKERYVDPSRIDPKKMLFAALDSVQFNIPEVLVEPDLPHNQVAVTINDKKETFSTGDVDSPWRLQGKLKKIFRFIEANMNAGADLSKVEYAAVNGMLSTLDPHSVLLDPEAAREMDVSTSGKFGGLGIVIRTIDHKLMVVRPMKDTPAWRSGIKAGDHIVRINNIPTENLTSNEAVDRMRGDPKTSVTLWIARASTKDLLRFDLVRDLIRVSQVDHKLLDHGVGYIRIKQFSKGIAADVGEAMRDMSSHGATAWIVDLRGNPGGLLEEAVRLADLFVDSGTLVTTVSGRDREARRAVRGFGDNTSSLAVLVNGGSASASEIVAGALKNLDRAVIIGTKTFGKGSVQELYDNDDRSKLKLTIAEYLTPGDRSIQNLGIVPDIQLQRMYVPDPAKAITRKIASQGKGEPTDKAGKTENVIVKGKNDATLDFVRMLAPTHSYGEKDLDAHLVSTYAKEGELPAYQVPFLFERKKATNDGEAETTLPLDDDEVAETDDIVEDWEISFAKDVVSARPSANRAALVASADKVVARARANEERKLMTALAGIGVDWSAPTSGSGANLEVSIATSAPLVKAGDELAVTATVKNVGTKAAYRVLPRIQTDDRVFDDVELPVGKVGPGETKTYSTKIKLPQDALDRVDRLGLEVREANNAPSKVIPGEIHIAAAARPVFAYAWQLVDEGNGDGLVQRGEKYHLRVSIKNTGDGPSTTDAQVVLRNASGDGVDLDKSRFDIGVLPPGKIKEIAFPLATTAALKSDEMVLELMAYDANLDAQSSDKLHFAVSANVPGRPQHGEITVKIPTAIRAGASDSSSVVASATRGVTYPAIGAFGTWTKIQVADNVVGFVPTAAVATGGRGKANFTPVWNSTPPRIDLATNNLETSAETFTLRGSVSDEAHIEDMYIIVSNPRAKIEGRKVFYRSNRGAKDSKLLDFSAGVPLWSGSNMVTIVARESSDVRSVKTVYVYRDPPQTAQATRGPNPAAPPR